jgi:hypothetical protein
LEEFLTRYEEEVSDSQRLLALDITLKATPARWWGTPKETIKHWYQCKRLLLIKFGTEQKEDRNLEIQWTGGTNGTLGEVKSTVENDTPRGMAPSFCTHTRGHPSKLVHRPGTE